MLIIKYNNNSLKKLSTLHRFKIIFSIFLGLTAKQLSAAQAAAQGMSVDQMKNFVQNDLRNIVCFISN